VLAFLSASRASTLGLQQGRHPPPSQVRKNTPRPVGGMGHVCDAKSHSREKAGPIFGLAQCLDDGGTHAPAFIFKHVGHVTAPQCDTFFPPFPHKLNSRGCP
jgi:hypothetical protein